MSRDIVLAAQGPFLHAWGLLATYIETCPENVWKEKNGGWPVWQQIAHAVMSLDFFVRGTEDFLPAPCDVDTGMLEVQGSSVVSRQAMQAYAAAVKERVDAWLAGLTDADLTRLDPVLTQTLGWDVPYAAVLGMLASHTGYHLGSCDAALRDHGLPGVF